MSFLVFCVLIALAVLLHLFFKMRRERYLACFSLQLVELLETLVSALRAGSSFFQALHLALENAQDPLAKEFSPLLHEYRLGLPLEEGLQKLKTRIASEDLHSFFAAVRIAQTSGGSLATVLHRLSSHLREQNVIRRRAQALASQGKLQGYVMGAMPILITLMMNWIDPQLTQDFWQGSWGQTIFVVILFAQVAALCVIERILRIRV